jgi:hypothetical protein
MVYMPREPKTTPNRRLYSEEEVYVRRSGDDFLNTEAHKWEYEKPVPAVVIGMVGERVLAVLSDAKEVALLEQNQVWTTTKGTPHRLELGYDDVA